MTRPLRGYPALEGVFAVETRLELSEQAVAENVRPIRHRVMEAAVGAGVGETKAEEVGLCVGEAVANAVRHAYPGEPGDVAVLVQVDDEEDELVVFVRDRGRGMIGGGDSDGFGLHIIESLSDLVVTSRPDRGTVVRMCFPIGVRRGPPLHAAQRGMRS